jgi:hypothetical protein
VNVSSEAHRLGSIDFDDLNYKGKRSECVAETLSLPGRLCFVLCTNPLSLGSSCDLQVSVARPILLKESRMDGSFSSSGKPVGTENRGLFEALRFCSGFNNSWCSIRSKLLHSRMLATIKMRL